VRYLLAFAGIRRLGNEAMDVKVGFPTRWHAKKEIYMEQPEGFRQNKEKKESL